MLFLAQVIEEVAIALSKANESIERVRELHKPNGAGMCMECMPDGMIRMPCATIQALDGN